MDAKTYEFMKARTGKFELLERDLEQLNHFKEEMQGYSGLGVRTNSCYREFNKETTSKLREALDKFIDIRVIEIAKEMEEI